MNLTVQTDYALRVLMLLAAREPKTVTIQEMAEHYEISRGHLMAIVHRLGGLGFLENSRGRGGGVKLARGAAEIRLDEVVRATEPEFRMAECFNLESNRCLITAPCRLRSVLEDALEAWFKVLRGYTVADLINKNQPLVKLLHPRGIDSATQQRRPRA